MNIRTININGKTVAIMDSDTILLSDAQTGLDLIATARYDAGEVDAIIISKHAVDERFFELRTGIAGEILQKFINYQMKLAIIGDFSGYTSKALADFIRESNRGRDIFFVPTEQEAVDKLSAGMR